jgi:hypothetical protein
MRLTQERLKKLIDYDKRTDEFTWKCRPPNSIQHWRYCRISSPKMAG